MPLQVTAGLCAALWCATSSRSSRGPQTVSPASDGANQDHVLVSDDFDVLDYTVLTYSYWSEEKPSAEALEAIKAGEDGVVVHKQRLPSDHYPIGIHLKL